MPTPTQRDNLKTLSTYLHANTTQLDFDMAVFTQRHEDARELTPEEFAEHPCGTVGCAVGHGPLAGIKPLPREDWSDYSDRVFGTDEIGVFAGLFSGNWANVDNSPSGAAERIDCYLETGDLFYPSGERIA